MASRSLPANVVNAIQSGHKIEAIKLLREAEGLGLKEAKHAVEDYIRADPVLRERQSSSSGGALFIAALLAAVYAIYKFFI